MIERCVNCGCFIEGAKKIIVGGYLGEHEWTCSGSCYDEHAEKGCPLEGNGAYRQKFDK